MAKTYVISLGGSLIFPEGGIDVKFLKNFRNLILTRVKAGEKFFIVSGGGRICRDYQKAATKIVKITNDDQDWLGIHSSRLNAHLLRTIFRDVAHPEIIKIPAFRMAAGEKVVIAGAWKPGWSTDYVATMIAQEYEVKTVINLSNIDYVYNKDPRKFKNAKKYESISWKNFRKIVGNKWSPGLNAPFDPIASAKGEQNGLEVVIMNGKNLKNLEGYFAGKKFEGTVISRNS